MTEPAAVDTMMAAGPRGPGGTRPVQEITTSGRMLVLPGAGVTPTDPARPGGDAARSARGWAWEPSGAGAAKAEPARSVEAVSTPTKGSQIVRVTIPPLCGPTGPIGKAREAAVADEPPGVIPSNAARPRERQPLLATPGDWTRGLLTHSGRHAGR